MKLKPCPFCGNTKPEVRKSLIDLGFYIECPACRAIGPWDRKETRRETIRLWNSRAFQLKEIEWANED